jgi:4-amino-4-deoxy-L-arabinose transferase-like glycosyltransferase
LNKVLSEHRTFVWMLLAGVLVRLVILVAVQSTGLKIEDEQQYAQLAKSLNDGRGFAWADRGLTSMRPPLYPVFIAAVWRLTGTESIQAVRAAQIVVALATVALLYMLTLRLFDRRTAILAAAALCFYPSFLFSGVLLLTETLVTLFLLMLAVEYFALIKRPSATMAAAIGATVGLAALTRSVFWPYPLLLVPLTFFSVAGPALRRARIALIILVTYAAVVGPWALRNTRLQRTVTIVDTMGGMNLRMGNYEHTPIERMWDAVALTGDRSWSYELGLHVPEAVTWTDGQKDKWAQRAALAYMASHPRQTLIRSVVKFGDFWGMERELVAGLRSGLYQPPAWLAMVMVAAVGVAYPLLALGAIAGLFRAPVSSRPMHFLILSIGVLLTGIHTIVFGHSRYHLPLVPFLAMYAAAAVTQIDWRSLFAQPRRSLLPLTAMAMLLTIWVRELLVRDLVRVEALLKLLT